MFAAILLVALWSRPEWRLPEGIDYATLSGDLFAIGFVIVLALKFHSWRKSPTRVEDGLTWTGESRPPAPRARRE